ncbi:MAG TPA: DUF664 domain-containing protein [Marmoricola sp.]|nr:DUF664 domain-containing protein [Marmoricola sp.]
MTEEPAPVTGDPAGLFVAYLDFYRERAIEKVLALPPDEQRGSRLPSGWSPLELLFHLACMERRWFVWGFRGEPVEHPWEDSADDPAAPWQLPAGRGTDDVVALLRETGQVTGAVLATEPLEAVAATGGRFQDDPPPLGWICFHVLQEYARHVGHLDVAVELAGGPTGE